MSFKAKSFCALLVAFVLSSAGCSRSAVEEAGGTAATVPSIGQLDGYWEYQKPALELGEYGRVARIDLISGGRFFSLRVYSDLTTEKVPSPHESKWDGNRTLTTEFVSEDDEGVPLRVVSRFVVQSPTEATDQVTETYADGKSRAFEYRYRKIGEAEALARTPAFWFGQKQDYLFAHTYCDQAAQLKPTEALEVKRVIESVRGAADSGSKSIRELVELRKAAGEIRTECEVIEDLIERGERYAATGVLPRRYREPSPLEFNLTGLKRLPKLLASLELGGLRLWTISGDPVRDKDLSALTELDSLRVLVLDDVGVVRLDAAWLTRLVELRSLSLNATRLEDYPLIALMGKLRHLVIGRSLEHDERLHLSFLGSMRSLESLTVPIRPGDSSAIAAIASLRLRELDVMVTLTSGAELAFVDQLPRIGSLSVEGLSGAVDLSTLTPANSAALRSLNVTLRGGQVEGVSALARLPALEYLTLQNAVMADLSGVEQVLSSAAQPRVYLGEIRLPASQQAVSKSLQQRFGARYTASQLTF